MLLGRDKVRDTTPRRARRALAGPALAFSLRHRPSILSPAPRDKTVRRA